MSNQLEILEVLECAKNGDARCQRIIYEVITPFIYHLILKYVPNEDDAADLAQETMITAFEKLKNYNSDKGSFKSWTAKIAINKALKWKNSRMSLVSPEEFEKLMRILTNEQNSLEVEELTAELNQSQKELFNLYFELGFSHQEIADSLGITVSNSRVRVHRMVTILKRFRS